MDVVEARLANITTANGYFSDMATPERARLTPFNEADLPAINLWHGDDVYNPGASGGGFSERELTVVLEARDKTRDRPFVDVAAELASDMLIAINRDTASPQVSDQPSTRLGGLVSGIQLRTYTPELGEGQKPWCGATLVFAVNYRVQNTDPLTIVP
jgi:hypothetical protein